MEPNYYTSEMLLVNQIDKQLQRGQVVAVYEDKEIALRAKNSNPIQGYFVRFDPETRFFLKRVIALPGEEVEMVGGRIIIYNSQNPNGIVLDEPYVARSVKLREEVIDYYYPRTKVDPGTYFLLGDNRVNSTDSRVKGNFPDYTIFGLETMRYWPIGRAGLFELPKYDYLPIDEYLRARIEKARQTNIQGSEL